MIGSAKILVIAFLLLMNLNSTPQNNKIILQHENGKEYIYEFQNINYWENEDGEKRNMLIRRKTFKVKVNNESPDGKKYLNINLSKNTIENPNSNITCIKDYRYPEYREEYYDERPPDFNISVDENIDTNNTMVPSMLLQPFAENAIIHGLQTKAGNRELNIEVFKATAIYSKKHFTLTGSLTHKGHTDMSAQNAMVHKNRNEISNAGLTDKHLAKPEIQGILISVEDNGIGREAAKNMGSAKNGKSSKLLKERLEILSQKQKDKCHLEIIDLKNNGATGTRVEIFIPEEE